MQNSDQLLCAKDVARLLQVSASTLAKWRVSKRDAFPFLKIGRAVRYRLSDVESYLRTRIRYSTSDTSFGSAPRCPI